MARRAGRNGRVYMGIASGSAAAEPLPFQASWSINFQTEKTDVTAFGDTNKVYVAGLPDSSGEFGGFYDDATAQTYTAATDGLARKFYLYPDIVNTPTQYWFGTVFPDFSVNTTVSGAVEVSSSWSAASSILKVG